ncbi:30S ribosomal protein S14 [Candidatus Woesearchaeota archaeon]|nr:30S ribosomal protein S14 [Candidatus Woesearchaeota archaeon]
MTTKDYKKLFTQLKVKEEKLLKYKKHNSPKKRSCGIGKRKCRICGRTGAHISAYNLDLCRQCFRDYAKSIGFKKYH